MAKEKKSITLNAIVLISQSVVCSDQEAEQEDFRSHTEESWSYQTSGELQCWGKFPNRCSHWT